MTKVKIFDLSRDVSGSNAECPEFSNKLYAASLNAGANATFTVPYDAQRYVAEFTYSSAVTLPAIWASYNNTAAAAGAGFSASNSELRPTRRILRQGDTVNFLNSEAASVGISIKLWAVQMSQLLV